jgi:hypothetical protein
MMRLLSKLSAIKLMQALSFVIVNSNVLILSQSAQLTEMSRTVREYVPW